MAEQLSRVTVINRLRRKVREAALAKGFAPEEAREVMLANYALSVCNQTARATILRELLDKMIGRALVEEIIQTRVSLQEMGTL